MENIKSELIVPFVMVLFYLYYFFISVAVLISEIKPG